MRKVLALFFMATWTVGILYVLFGLHYMDIEARMEQVRQTRSQWLSAQGTILEIKSHSATDDNDSSSVIVKFQYEAFGSRQVAQQKWGDYTKGYKEANSYRKGQVVTVYYDPGDSMKAVINRESVDLYEVSAWWETILRILAYPSIIIGCIIIWGLVASSKPEPK